MSNFTFLETEWPEIYNTAVRVESYTNSDHRTACFHARRALEQAVNWLYDHDSAFDRPYDTGLITLLNDMSFKENTSYEIGSKAHYIRKMGNRAVHSSKPISKRDSLNVVRDLYHLLYWLARTYTSGDPNAIPNQFDDNLIPLPVEKVKLQTVKQLKLLDEELSTKDKELREKEQTLADFEAEIASLQAQIALVKQANTQVVIDHDYNEAETREHLIDMLLREVGWDPRAENAVEYKVTGMPNPDGVGKVDYVLWGNDGKPLGLVEAKRTSKDTKEGKRQAELYANCLEQMHGQRPIIFYTNGYDTWIWDDTHYPERTVQGFYTKDDLELLIQRRETAKNLIEVATNTEIVDRHYQEEGIRSLCDDLEKKYRKGLLVMATGSGKTRVAIALVDLMMRANWVKRVLFLADRQALVRQAVSAFKRHLPEANPVNLLEEKDAKENRVVVSTYHTMMGMIDETKEADQKRFSVGHFDLVIIDEAHRSIYHKFGVIFGYFDSLLLGLTATPKDEVDRNTYRLFDLEDGVPTFDYELEKAVADGFLVPPRAMSVPVKFQREGIKYDDLSDDEKLEWDLIDWGEGVEPPEHVSPTALNKWLFNEDTVDKVVEHLMRHGIKVKGGDRLGKTIIFAKNHKHAEFIQERFDKNYPYLVGKFARVIDTYVKYAHTLIDDFSKPESDPHIAISVDMLDTGIDIHEVVNLVFFKLVRSKTKFFQMIGRGTRLCPDLFGPGEDKEEFLIFDYCMNFEFFAQNPKGFVTRPKEPLSQNIFKLRLDLLEHYAGLKTNNEEIAELDLNLKDQMHQLVTAMPLDNFIVRPKRRWVEKYRNTINWKNLSQTDIADLALHVSGLPISLPEDEETAKRFDLMVLQMQLAFLEGAPLYPRLKEQIIKLAGQLEAKSTIPLVNSQLVFILEVQEEMYWEGITLKMMEDIRLKLRDLIRFIDKQEQRIVYSDFKDELGEMQPAPGIIFSTGVNITQYRKKIKKFINSHLEHQVIRKIRFAMPLTTDDLLQLEEFLFEAEKIGTKEDFINAYPLEKNLPAFIRSLVGLDRKAAKEAFSRYLDNKTFTADQIRFVNYIIDHLTMNGSIEERLLYEQPYTDIHEYGLDGVFPMEADNIISVIRKLKQSILTQSVSLN